MRLQWLLASCTCIISSPESILFVCHANTQVRMLRVFRLYAHLLASRSSSPVRPGRCPKHLLGTERGQEGRVAGLTLPSHPIGGWAGLSVNTRAYLAKCLDAHVSLRGRLVSGFATPGLHCLLTFTSNAEATQMAVAVLLVRLCESTSMTNMRAAPQDLRTKLEQKKGRSASAEPTPVLSPGITLVAIPKACGWKARQLDSASS